MTSPNNNHLERLDAKGNARVHNGNNITTKKYHFYLRRPKNTIPETVIREHGTPHWNVPFDRNKGFVGRACILERLLKMIPPSAWKDGCQRTVIEGLGGIGKTQLALEAVFRLHENYKACSIFWVHALSAASFENSYHEIGRQLNIEGIDDENADIKLLVKTALSNWGREWLLVVDNADDSELLFGSTTETSPLISYLPSNKNGSILFTTRHHFITAELDITDTNIIRVAEMDRNEGQELLINSLKSEQIDDSKTTQELLDFLENLPLAIKQASAYMRRLGIKTSKYLEYCKESDAALIKLLSKGYASQAQGRYDSIQTPVATTWLISFEHISRDNPVAAQYLQFMSMLSEKDIPITLLPLKPDRQVELEALGMLEAYAFITKRRGQDSYDMHRLVRLVLRNWLQDQKAQDMYTTMIRYLSSIFRPPCDRNRQAWAGYLPHLVSALCFEVNCTDMEMLEGLSEEVASGIYSKGYYEEVAILHRNLIKISESLFEGNHPNIRRHKSQLVSVLVTQGKFEEAADLLQEILPDGCYESQNALDIANMSNQSTCFSFQGKHEEAGNSLQKALEQSEKLLGKEHRQTIILVHCLATNLGFQGNYEDSAKMYQDALTLSKKAFGEDDLETLSVMFNIAALLEVRGKLKEAEEAFQEVLDLYKNIIGKDHHQTLLCQRRLQVFRGKLSSRVTVVVENRLAVQRSAGSIALLRDVMTELRERFSVKFSPSYTRRGRSEKR